MMEVVRLFDDGREVKELVLEKKTGIAEIVIIRKVDFDFLTAAGISAKDIEADIVLDCSDIFASGKEFQIGAVRLHIARYRWDPPVAVLERGFSEEWLREAKNAHRYGVTASVMKGTSVNVRDEVKDLGAIR